jgi:thiol-disulfide isomerase/thioredoxin
MSGAAPMNARVLAPELPDSLAWINAGQAPSLAALRGRVVLLHFWTFDSVNCLNALADLRYLESKYHDGLSVIGVHTPKYDYQTQSAPVLKAVNRCHIRHPVASDPDYALWRGYGVQSWPSFAIVDAEGRFAALLTGEGRRDEADAIIGQLLDEAAARDLRVYESSVATVRPEPRMPLQFPGKLIATASALWISDSGNNRVLECDHSGRILRQIGSGNPGLWDGRNREAGFNNPQGLAIMQDALYVADAGNHAVRRVLLHTGEVTTVAGSGALGHDLPGETQDPKQVRMSAPNDLAAHEDKLYIAVSGQHQVWRLDLGRNRLAVLAGNGRFGTNDGDALAASFAQPCALGLFGQQLIVLDAAGSAVRSIDLAEQRVTTLVGAGPYEFGDAGGKRDSARLQNPLGLCVDPRGLAFIADSYNGKVKALNLRSGELRALNLPYHLQEPGGISLAANALWIANTNGHEIVRVDLATGQVQHLTIV